MNIQHITKNNYNTLVEWYIGWDLPITPFSFIPKTAFIVDNVCAGFLYQLDNTPMFWVEGVVTNPAIKDKQLKKIALCGLIKKLEESAFKQGGKLLMSSTPRESLNTTFLSLGFKNTPENYFHLAKEL